MLIKLIAQLQALKTEQDGATAIEYGLIAGGISLAIVAAVFAFGDSLGGMFDNIASAMDEAATQTASGDGSD